MLLWVIRFHFRVDLVEGNVKALYLSCLQLKVLGKEDLGDAFLRVCGNVSGVYFIKDESRFDVKLFCL